MASNNAQSADMYRVNKDWLKLVFHALLLLVIFASPLYSGPFLLKLANTAAVTAIAAMGLTVLTGTAGLLSLGQAAFLAIGAFCGALLANYVGMPMILNILAGGLVAALIGALIAAVTVRTVGIYLAVGTFALQHVVELTLTDIEVKLTQAMGFQMDAPSLFGFEIETEKDWWVILSINVFLVWAVLSWLVKSHVGRNWILVRDQPSVAAAFGLSITLNRISAFALCAFVGGTVGVLHGYYIGTVQVTNYSLHLSIVYLTAIVLGGAGNIIGAIWASALITLLPHALGSIMHLAGIEVLSGGAGLENISLGLILIFVLLQTPKKIMRILRVPSR